ncbi:DALR anticodon-binding domain-containing protein 3-like [Ornithodoros turicata]|uniref:DALR anticodon-binding domain-containing protein 3-like n=1 Tax=Ornithodoros turicata TaxID=34597 RepID=UPI003139E5B9
MDVQKRLTLFLNEFCAANAISEAPAAEIVRTRSKNANIKADCRIYVRPTQLSAFQECMDRFIEQVLKSSTTWPIPIGKCSFHAETSYIEMWLPRTVAFKSHLKSLTQDRKPVKCGGEVAFVYVPYVEPSFTSVRTEMLAAYTAACYSNEGFLTSIYVREAKNINVPTTVTRIQHTDQIQFMSDEKVSELLQRCQYYDSTSGMLNLREYLQSKGGKAVSGCDTNVCSVNQDSVAFRTAVSLLDVVQSHFKQLPDLIVHVVPHGKSFVVQNAGLIFELLCSLLTESAICRRQQYLIHDCVSAPGCDSPEKYISQTKLYLREAFVQRCQTRSAEDLERSIKILAWSKLAFEILGSKQNMKVALKQADNYEGKGGLFVQYTSARISALLSKYEDEVANGTYPALSAIEDVDFSALDSDLEWKLWHSLDSCKHLLENMQLCRNYVRVEVHAHKLCEELIAMCLAFGAFYSKVKVLVEPRQHLLGTVMARLWLIKGVRVTLCRMLEILSLQPLDWM